MARLSFPLLPPDNLSVRREAYAVRPTRLITSSTSRFTSLTPLMRA